MSVALCPLVLALLAVEPRGVGGVAREVARSGLADSARRVLLAARAERTVDPERSLFHRFVLLPQLAELPRIGEAQVAKGRIGVLLGVPFALGDGLLPGLRMLTDLVRAERV